MFVYIDLVLIHAPSSSCPTVNLDNSCHGVWLFNGLIFLFDLLFLNSKLDINTSTRLLLRSILILSPVFIIPKSPPAADSGETCNIDGLSDALIEDNSLYLGNDPNGTTDNAQYNVAVGTTALDAVTQGDNNTAIGYNAGNANTSGADNIIIGAESNVSSSNAINQIVIGSGAVGIGDNTVMLGNNSITDIYTPGNMHVRNENVFIGLNDLYNSIINTQKN